MTKFIRLTGYRANGTICEVREWVVSPLNPEGMEEAHSERMLTSRGGHAIDMGACVEVQSETWVE